MSSATLIDKLFLPPKLAYLLASVATAAITGPFRGSDGASTYGEHLLTAGYRTLLTNFTIGQAQ